MIQKKKYSVTIPNGLNLFLTGLFILFSIISFSQDITKNDALCASQNWLTQNIKNSYKVKSINENYYKGILTLYIANLEPKGFIVLASEKDIEPILAYSYENNFTSDTKNTSVKEWINGYSEVIKDVITKKTFAKTKRKKWEYLLNGKNYIKKNTNDVSPLVESEWAQGNGWNQHCPYDTNGPGNHAVVGCVATAMGQIVKKWNYPVTGSGSHSYTHPTYGTISANFGNTSYNWNSMYNTIPNQHSALLLFHCGVSVDMNYGASSSGAFSSDVRDAIVNYFNFSTDANYIHKSNYTTTQWENTLINELDNDRPVYYRGHGTGGHAFVCDGYQNSDFFHFNWGWSGSQNGYFYLNDLTPGAGNYNNNQSAVIGIHPNSTTPTPVNDECYSAIELNSSNNFCQYSASNENATETYPSSVCSGSESLIVNDVWFKFVASKNSHTIDVSPSSGFDAVVGLYSGCSEYSLIDCIDNGGGDGGDESLYVSGLNIGNTYYIRVYEWTNLGQLPTTFTFDVFVDGTTIGCEAPTNTYENNITQNSVTLIVADEPNAEEYRFKWYDNDGYINSEYTTSNSHNLTSLNANTEYHWKVKIKCGGEWTDYSSFSYFTTEADLSCEAPTNTYENNITQNSVALIVADEPNAERYHFKWYDDDYGFINEEYITTNILDLTGLNPNTEYYWKVKLLCGGEWTPFSEFSYFTTDTNIEVKNFPKKNISLFPNPTSGTLYIYNPLQLDIISISISNALGQQILETKNIINPINLTAFNNGIYFLTIEYEKKQIKKFKIVKE